MIKPLFRNMCKPYTYGKIDVFNQNIKHIVESNNQKRIPPAENIEVKPGDSILKQGIMRLLPGNIFYVKWKSYQNRVNPSGGS